MSDVRVERGTTARLEHVEGNLKASRNARISAAKGNLVRVSGGAYFEGSAEIDCDFECDSLRVDRGRLKVTGNLTVRNDMDVAHSVEVDGAIRARRIDVGGKLLAKAISCERSVTVGGIVGVAEALEAESVEVGGKVAVSGNVKIKDLGVGGKAEVGGGSISGQVKVGGVFASSGPLQFGEMQVYGKCTLPAGCKGQKISTFGKLSVAGALSCEEIDVGGVTDVQGDCNAGKISVNGRLSIYGSLAVAGTLEANGSGEVGGEVKGTDLRVGGTFRARRVILSNEADIAGELETEQGMKAKSVTIRSGTRCKGPVIGGRVELGMSSLAIANWRASWAGQSIQMRFVGRMTDAEDVYGEEVILGRNSRCRKIFAKRVEVADGCTVEQIIYTEELRGENHKVFFNRPPEKVPSLPSFPL
jgi:cytoskeletal protein CcmA (bactofilin family)